MEETTTPLESLPVSFIASDLKSLKPVEDGIALCLSGGGYRAMLFHLGAIIRLNELAYLPKLKRVSSVSGGSITAGVLAMNWDELSFKDEVVVNLGEKLTAPIKKMASTSIDAKCIISGLITPGVSIADKVVKAYNKHLFNGFKLSALPDEPRFVINATNVMSGVLWRFSKPYMADYRVGMINKPDLELARAVAASSAFPPILSPMKLPLTSYSFEPKTTEDLHFPPYTELAVLTDGGVYDNLGLETAWKRYKTILCSDGGQKMAPDPNPAVNWVCHSMRINSMIDNQVRSLRKRQLIASYCAPEGSPFKRSGAYWGINTDISEYKLSNALPAPKDKTEVLAEEGTRLKAMDEALQNKIINWGYAVCDAAMRKYGGAASKTPPEFPFDGAVG